MPTLLVIGLLVGMLTNLLAGALARICRMSWMLSISMLLLGLAYAILPLVRTAGHAYGFAVIQGVAGGMLTVLFFAVWRHAFGTEHLGRIQGAAQMLTVIASALGPLIVADSNVAAGTYSKILFAFAAISAVFALIAWLTPVPSAQAGAWRSAAASNSSPRLQQSPA